MPRNDEDELEKGPAPQSVSQKDALEKLRGLAATLNWGHVARNPDKNIDDTMWGGDTICPECGMGCDYGHQSNCHVYKQMVFLHELIDTVEGMSEKQWVTFAEWLCEFQEV